MKPAFTAALCLLFTLASFHNHLTNAQSLVASIEFKHLQPIVGQASQGDRSPRLSDISPVTDASSNKPAFTTHRVVPRTTASSRQANATPFPSDPLIQPGGNQEFMVSPTITFEGIGNLYGYVPSDANGDVGPNDYVQTVNMAMAVYTKTTGALRFGPVAINTLWSGFGGPCQTTNSGDPIVVYDSLADRWLISQLSIPSNTGPFYQCVAVSASSDPTGAYFRYAFQMPVQPGYPNGKFNDYPKLAIWPDAYLMTMNQFSSATSSAAWAGAGVFAFNRNQMLSGVTTPTYVYFDLAQVDLNFGNMLPADLDGPRAPPPGAPGYFAEVDNNADLTPNLGLRIWQLHVDWSTPAAATFGQDGQPDSILPVAPFDYLPCVPYSLQCIPQPGTTVTLDALGDRLMHRLVYRNYGFYESIVANHTINAGGAIAGIRWYEIRNPGTSPTIAQQGTWAPDSTHRWMGSIAMDHDGNIALGYSASSTSLYPSIDYAGRLASDPPGLMSRGEGVIIAGGGSQLTSLSRWGDYSSMSIDPSDDCTFWYTNQYYNTTGYSSWRTRIGSFRFPSCPQPTYTVSGKVTNALTGNPLAATVAIADNVTDTPMAFANTDANGRYTISLLGGKTYTLTASASFSVPEVRVLANLNDNQHQDFSLLPLLRLLIVMNP